MVGLQYSLTDLQSNIAIRGLNSFFLAKSKNNVRESQKKQVLQYAKKNKFGKNKSTPEKGLSKGMM
jgi:hypothetical protein